MKLLRQKKDGYFAFGYTTALATYGRCFSGKYTIELIMPIASIAVKLYLGNKKPLIKNIYLVSALWSLFIPALLIAMFIFFLLYTYFDGARNFVRDSAWVNNVREFNWANIVIIIILAILLAIK